MQTSKEFVQHWQKIAASVSCGELLDMLAAALEEPSLNAEKIWIFKAELVCKARSGE